MITKKTLSIILVCLLSVSTLTGFGINDLVKEIEPNTEKCDGDSNCKNKERLKSAAKVAAVVVASKLIYDMTIDFTSEEVTNEKSLSKKYLKKNNTLPKKPIVLEYTSSIKPGEVVSTGKKTLVASYLEVVPDNKKSEVKIEEKITIYDNEKPDQAIKSLVKQVNNKKLRAGAFKNEFSFKLPAGMPQGVYPVRTSILINGKELEETKTRMQVVLHVYPDQSFQIASL